MEVMAGFDVFLEGQQKLVDGQNKLLKRSQKPVHRVIFGSTINGASTANALLINTLDQVDSGRLWNITKILVAGNDGHTPLLAPVTSPAVPASTVPAFNNSSQPVQVAITGGTISAVSINGVATGITASPATVTVPAGGYISITYTVAPTWVWTGTTTTATVDLYAASSALVLPNLSAEIAPGLAIPSLTYPPEEAEWLHYGEGILGLAYNVPANASIFIAVRITDWPMEAIESLDIA
jgi:hypothetical protein